MKSILSLIGNSSKFLLNNVNLIESRLPAMVPASLIHTSGTVLAAQKHADAKHWVQYNKTIYPPQSPEELPRKAFVCHMKENIRYSPKKLWYIACLVRGMTVDEALKQLSFVLKFGATPIYQTILEAQNRAVKQHNVEFRSNLWIAESFVGKGRYFKGVRRHARGRFGRVEYKHSHYFVRLEEGTPPEDYYRKQISPDQQLDEWLEKMRKRKITSSL